MSAKPKGKRWREIAVDLSDRLDRDRKLAADRIESDRLRIEELEAENAALHAKLDAIATVLAPELAPDYAPAQVSIEWYPIAKQTAPVNEARLQPLLIADRLVDFQGGRLRLHYTVEADIFARLAPPTASEIVEALWFVHNARVSPAPDYFIEVLHNQQVDFLTIEAKIREAGLLR